MTQQNAIQIFEELKVRSVWDDDREEWYFSIIDVVAVLTESVDATAYWRKLKQRLKAEGNETVTSCHAFKMQAVDGKMRKTDVATPEQLFRLIQSIPSSKAEPFKLWIARVAAERLDQMADPELSIEQAMTDYKCLGYSDNWINKRYGLKLTHAKKVNVPLLAATVANVECRFVTEYRPGNCPLIVGEVVASHVNTDENIKRLVNLGKRL